MWGLLVMLLIQPLKNLHVLLLSLETMKQKSIYFTNISYTENEYGLDCETLNLTRSSQKHLLTMQHVVATTTNDFPLLHVL